MWFAVEVEHILAEEVAADTCLVVLAAYLVALVAYLAALVNVDNLVVEVAFLVVQVALVVAGTLVAVLAAFEEVAYLVVLMGVVDSSDRPSY